MPENRFSKKERRNSNREIKPKQYLLFALEPEKESTLPPPAVVDGLLSPGASSRGMYSAKMERTGAHDEEGRGRKAKRAARIRVMSAEFYVFVSVLEERLKIDTTREVGLRTSWSKGLEGLTHRDCLHPYLARASVPVSASNTRSPPPSCPRSPM